MRGVPLRSLREIRVRAAPSWDADAVELTFWFVRNDDERAFEIDDWELCMTALPQPESTYERFVRVDGVVLTLDDLTDRDFCRGDRDSGGLLLAGHGCRAAGAARRPGDRHRSVARRTDEPRCIHRRDRAVSRYPSHGHFHDAPVLVANRGSQPNGLAQSNQGCRSGRDRYRCRHWRWWSERRGRDRLLTPAGHRRQEDARNDSGIRKAPHFDRSDCRWRTFTISTLPLGGYLL